MGRLPPCIEWACTHHSWPGFWPVARASRIRATSLRTRLPRTHAWILVAATLARRLRTSSFFFQALWIRTTTASMAAGT
eukprot:scaffold668614_cov57-Prasinocladus_malaysianus.AAC.1